MLVSLSDEVINTNVLISFGILLNSLDDLLDYFTWASDDSKQTNDEPKKVNMEIFEADAELIKVDKPNGKALYTATKKDTVVYEKG